MGEVARVHSIETLKIFKVYLLKFAEAANVALGDAESEMSRTMQWLELEQNIFWQTQVRKRTEAVSKAKDAVRQKKLFKDSSGGRQSAVDEERALSIAQRRLEEAEQKVIAVRQYTRRLHREIQMYKGGVQRFATSVQSDLPRAAYRLENMVRSLEKYVSLTMGDAWESSATMGTGFTRAGAGGGGSVADLRKLTPPPEVRAAAVPEEMTRDPWIVGPLSPEDQKRMEGLSTLQAAGATFAGDARIVIGKGTFESPRIYLEHGEATGPEDTGWYMGPAGDQGIISCQSVRLADLLIARPDLRPVLTLPQGALLVLGGAGVEAVYDSQGEDHWGAALAAEAVLAEAQSQAEQEPVDQPAAKPAT